MKIWEIVKETASGAIVPVTTPMGIQPTGNPANDAIKKYAIYIENHCSDALEAYRNTQRVLFRGDWAHNDLVFVGNPPVNRKPLDIAGSFQKKFDTSLIKAGFKALRPNSIFGSTNRDFAAEYGTVYIIFPMNGFSCTWSEMVEDLHTDVYLSYGPLMFKDFKSDIDKMRPVDLWEKYKYHKDNFTEALQYPNEIMIHGNYVAVNATRNIEGLKICELLGLPLDWTSSSSKEEDWEGEENDTYEPF